MQPTHFFVCSISEHRPTVSVPTVHMACDKFHTHIHIYEEVYEEILFVLLVWKLLFNI